MMGQIPPCGTGETDIILDETKLLDIEQEDEYQLKNIDEWDDDIDYCDDNVGIEFNLDMVDADTYENIPMINVT